MLRFSCDVLPATPWSPYIFVLQGVEETPQSQGRSLSFPFGRLCDEATSALDSVTEASILNALRNLALNRTAIFVAHRLTTAMQCDEIVVLDEGRVRERGTHDELLAKGGKYSEMWMQQVMAKEMENLEAVNEQVL